MCKNPSRWPQGDKKQKNKKTKPKPDEDESAYKINISDNIGKQRKNMLHNRFVEHKYRCKYVTLDLVQWLLVSYKRLRQKLK